MRIILTGLLLAATSLPAHAAIITGGTISGSTGDALQVALPIYSAPGEYRAYIAFSQPGSFTLAYRVERVTNLFCDFHDSQGFVPCGGDGVPIGFDLAAGPGATSATLAYAISPPFREDYGPDQFGLVFDEALDPGFEFVFEEDGTVSYHVVTAPVPEPAAWALMIAGFGLAGAGLRRRKAVLA